MKARSPDRRRPHCGRVKLRTTERRAGHPVDRAFVGVRSAAIDVKDWEYESESVCPRHHEPDGRAVDIVSGPRGEDRIALMFYSDPPARLGSRRRTPPQASKVKILPGR